MPKEYRGINDLYFVRGDSQNDGGKAEPVDREENSGEQPKKDEPEVRLLEATWQPGPDGHKFNKKSILQIKAKFLQKTSNKRVVADTFVLFNNQEEDLGEQVEAFLSEDGVAEAEVTLYYSDAYSDALKKDPKATCQYKCTVKHTKGANEIESKPLDMPATTEPTSVVIRLDIDPEDPMFQDAVFKLFSTDSGKKYSKTLTVKDDKTPGDNYLDLEFPEVDESLAYTLTVDCEEEGLSYNLFENTPYEDLSND